MSDSSLARAREVAEKAVWIWENGLRRKKRMPLTAHGKKKLEPIAKLIATAIDEARLEARP